MPKSAKSVLITGAAHGIGAATAELFAKNGYDVIINYKTSAKEAEATAERSRQSGAGQAWAVQADLSNEADLAKLAKFVSEKVGQLDALINNAAFTDEANFEIATKSEIMFAFEQNLVIAILAIRTFVPDLMKPHSAVLNVSSIYGTDQGGSPSLPLYSANKAALINLTQTLAKKYAPHIRFNAVAPGFTYTKHWQTVTPERQKAVLATTLLNDWVQPKDISDTLLYLAEAGHVNAETIVVDAGWSKKDNH